MKKDLKLKWNELNDNSEKENILELFYNEKPFGLYVETGNPILPVSFEVSNELVLIDFFNELKQSKLNDGSLLFFISENNCIYFDREFFAKYNSKNIYYEEEETLGCFFQYIILHLDK